ncbi:MAG: hypothetical protein DCF15_07495 [Phormidesmis priestleyi]|uniref:Uncharacterized protein n=1 Tax=Phormidesmis priestleyi TaxID=268141 RepID=A0A2W4XJK4_9CYAN|nr:MAG: hypothetical protein DCF15_07495 [Phormidesmis priestleyi]
MPTGLPQDSKNPRLHFDIYAMLEGSQELYFGHEVQVNVNLVETVKLSTIGGQSLEKCYISPTKRRGVERRCLIWAPVKSGVLLGDQQKCGIPKTCTEPDCPICAPYGGLLAGSKTLIGRVTHGGGVAVQESLPAEKQRAMHPAIISSEGVKGDDKETPTPFKREYNQPGILYPVYNHGVSITDAEFSSVAYAFLDSLPRIGAGNPKGLAIAEEPTSQTPLLVVDRYLSPRGKRPIISPSKTNPQTAIDDFMRLAKYPQEPAEKIEHIEQSNFDRWIGNTALEKLQDYASQFVDEVLQVR